MSERECIRCGRRISPDTVLQAGVVTKQDYDSNYGQDASLSWCEERKGWISDADSCAEWISFKDYEGESKYM